jgi:hypothetical protein
MRRSTRPALILGGACLCATVAILVEGAWQPSCSFFPGMLPAILALQLCFALMAGFVTGYRPPRDREPVRAGLRASLIGSLSGPILFALNGTAILPPLCAEGVYPIGIFILVLILIFAIAPVSILGGAAVGWLGGQMARMNRGRIALACTLVTGFALSLLILLHQPINSGVRGIVKVPLCPYIPTNGCVLQASIAHITVHMPNSEQLVAETASDEHGRYQIALAPGKYEISAGQYGFDTGPHLITISANNYLTLELDAK